MSIFSSLEYQLAKVVSGLNQTALMEQQLDIMLKESQINNKLLQISENGNLISNSTSYNRFLHFILETSRSALKAEINKSFTASTTEKWTSVQSLSNNTPVEYLGIETQSELQYSNETYHDAEYLLESWWNIFDTRYLKHGWGWTLTLIVAYMFILVAGVIGNLIVILVVLMRPQMRTVTNMFIMNLAVADLFVIVFCVPSTLLTNIFQPWILGSFMCKAVAYVQGVSGCASAYSLAAISFDRCQAIYRNYERPRGFSQTVCIKTVLLIWIAAMALTIPWAVIFEVKVSEYDGLSYCVETWEHERTGNIYFLVVNLACFYAIPLLLIFISNWIIYCHVTHRDVPQGSASVTAAPIRKMHRDTKRHVLKMLGIVTLTFLFCWLPIYVLVIIIKFSENISESVYSMLGILMPIAQWLGSLNSSINPILYAFLNKKFRKMFRSILPSWISVKSASRNVRSHKPPCFITAQYMKKCTISRKTSQTSNLISRFSESSGTTSITAQSMSSTKSLSQRFDRRNPAAGIFVIAKIERTASGNITDL